MCLYNVASDTRVWAGIAAGGAKGRLKERVSCQSYECADCRHSRQGFRIPAPAERPVDGLGIFSACSHDPCLSFHRWLPFLLCCAPALTALWIR